MLIVASHMSYIINIFSILIINIFQEINNSGRQRSDSANDSEIAPDSLDDDKSVSSEHSSKTSSSSSSSSTTSSSHSSNSSNSSLLATKPCRLAQTFKTGDLMSEMNKTKVINKSDEFDLPVIKKGSMKSTKSAPKISSWIDPKSVKGTSSDAKKMEEWVSQKDKEKKEKLAKAKKEEKETKQRKQEEEEDKIIHQKKNFELWENKKKSILEQKIKKSEELKARKKEKERENIEKKKVNEKVFQNWKSHKEESIKETRRAALDKKKNEDSEKARLEDEKRTEQQRGFEKWIERHKELEKQKKDADRAAKEATEELELLEEYRKQDAEEDYCRWKSEKSLRKSPVERSVEHPLAWAPAGKSDGKHRTSPNTRPLSPGEPLSKTLSSLKHCPTYTRKLKTVDVCCRQISFWCHCQSENGGFHANGSPQPQFSSTPKPWGEVTSPVNLSRHTTPANSRPSTPNRRRSSAK